MGNLSLSLVNFLFDSLDKASFSWGLPTEDELVNLSIQNQPGNRNSLMKYKNIPRIISILDSYEDIERSLEYTENSEFSLNILNFDKDDHKGIFKNFREYVSLRDINLKISKSELICLCGPQGSGKTTLLQSILGETLFIDNETYGKLLC